MKKMTKNKTVKLTPKTTEKLFKKFHKEYKDAEPLVDEAVEKLCKMLEKR